MSSRFLHDFCTEDLSISLQTFFSCDVKAKGALKGPNANRGRENRLNSDPPSLRTGQADPASGSPVGGFTSERIDEPRQGLWSRRTTPARQRKRWANKDGPSTQPQRARVSPACWASAAGGVSVDPVRHFSPLLRSLRSVVTTSDEVPWESSYPLSGSRSGGSGQSSTVTPQPRIPQPRSPNYTEVQIYVEP